MQNINKKESWRSFQAQLQARKKRKRLFAKLIWRLPLAVIVTCAAAFLLTGNYAAFFKAKKSQEGLSGNTPAVELTKDEVSQLLEQKKFCALEENRFTAGLDDVPYVCHTTLDLPLQHLLIQKLNRLKKISRGKPQNIAIVAMEPETGEILAMTGFDLDKPEINPCLENDYPAASLFKIISAAAAVENLGFTSGTTLFFNGMKYTLYKNQLKETKNKYTVKTNLKEAFAESINPVFGKIGSNRLGGSTMEKYARAFGFNKRIDSELQFFPGSIVITDEPYQWAEVACGFNLTTRISPLFATMVTSAITNSGRIPLPRIIRKVTDARGKTVYNGEPKLYNRPINQKTALTVKHLMEGTITVGTAKNSFREFLRDPVLSRLSIGGKTGSLYNGEHTVKYDWFSGFAEAQKNNKKLVVAIVVGHGKYIGTRAAEYGKLMFKTFFENNLATADTKEKKSSG